MSSVPGAWLGLPLIALLASAPARAGAEVTEGPDPSGKWIVISQTEPQPGPGLVDTRPYSGLRPGYFVRIEGAFADRDAALARQKALAGQGCGQDRCYVRFAGERLETVGLEAARTAAARASGGKVFHAEALSLRGHPVPLVIVRTGELEDAGGDCPTGGEDVGNRTQVWLFWSAAGRKLAEWEGENGLLCCERWRARPAPARLQVRTAECRALSCGGACGRATRVVAVPEDMPHAAVAEELRCDEVVSALPIVALESSCEKLELSSSRFRILRPETRITRCPGDEDLVKRAEARTLTLEYKDGLLIRSTGSWAPFARQGWGCD